MIENSDCDLDLNKDGKVSDNEFKLILDRWINKKKMAWVALIGILVICILSFFIISEVKLKVLEEIIIWSFIILGSIVGAYMGFSSFAAANTGKR